MSNEQYIAICKSIDDFKSDITSKSNWQITANTTIIKCDTELSDYSKLSFGYYIDAKDAFEYLENENISMDSYDHVFFVTCFPDLPRSYFGLGGTFIQGDCGFSFIVYGSGAMDSTEYCYNISQTNWPAGLYVHEFIHSLERYAAKFGYFVPSADGAEKYGYENIDHWRNYYTDILNNNVFHDGEYIGVPFEVWSLPPRLANAK
jgi:hypothetical protein